LERQDYAPGEKGSILVKADLSQQSPGPHRFAIDVQYEAPEPRETRVELAVFNARDLVITPSEITLNSVGERAGSAHISIVDFREKPLKILQLTTSNTSLKARVVEEPTGYLPGWRYLIGVSTGNHLATGKHLERITIATDDPMHRILSIDAEINKMSRLCAAPRTVYLKRKAGTVPTGEIHVRDAEGHAVEIESIAEPGELLDFHIGKNGTGQPTITVAIKNAANQMQGFTTSVLIKVKNPCLEEIPATIVWQPTSAYSLQ
jgi:hypothetical protein